MSLRPSRQDARRRWWGIFFLLLAAGMLVWGQTVFRARLTGLGYIAYWMGCLFLTCLALLVALIDARVMRRRLQEEHQRLLREAFTADRSKSEKSGGSP